MTYQGDIALKSTDVVITDNIGRTLMVLRNYGGTQANFMVFDPTTRQQVGATKPLGFFLPVGAAGQLGHPPVFAWDEPGRRLWVLGFPSNEMAKADTGASLYTLSPDGRILSSRPFAPFSAGTTVVGFGYYPPAHKLYVVGQRQGDPTGLAGTYTVQINEMDPETGTSSWSTGPATVPSCQRAISFNAQAAIVRSPTTGKVYLGCGTGNLVVSPQPGLPAVAEVDIANPTTPAVTLHAVAGSYAAGESLADYAANKFILVSQGPNQPVQAAWIFDEVHGVFTGVVSAGNINVLMSTVDHRTGRVFVGIDGALLVGSDRLLKTPQALAARIKALNSAPNLGLVVASFADLIVIPTVNEKAEFLVGVYKADLPDFVEPSADDPDANTIDAAEAPGQVESDFNGDVQAFGLRTHEVAGVNGLIQNIFPQPVDYWAYINGLLQNSYPKDINQKPPVPNDGSRDIYFSRITKAHLSQDEATATAIEGDRDTNTEADYYLLTNSEWPYKEATCADFGTGKVKATESGAEVSCDEGKDLVEATTTHDQAAAVPGVLSTSGSTSTTKLERKAGEPVKLEATAEARSVSIGGVVNIGKITSVSTAQAGGRPKTAKSEYKRVFEDVSMPGYSCSKDCDPEAVVNQMNAVLGSKFRAELPGYQRAATPGGAHADVSREPWQHQQDVVLNDQSEAEQQIPALRVTYYNDNAQRSRAVFEFAATNASADFRLFKVYGGDGGLEPSLAGSNFGSDEPGGDGGISPTVITPTDTPVGNVDVPKNAGGLLKRLGRGLRILLLGRHHTLLSVLLWALLATPVFLAARRRYLLRLMGELQ